MADVPPSCVITDPSSTYIRQLETKVKLLEGDKLPVQVGRPRVDLGDHVCGCPRAHVSPPPSHPPLLCAPLSQRTWAPFPLHTRNLDTPPIPPQAFLWNAGT